MEISRQNVGIDIAKDSFVSTLAIITIDQVVHNLGTKKFNNNSDGFKAFISWVKKLSYKEIDINYTMEATGVYYESLAYFLNNMNATFMYYFLIRQRNLLKALILKAKLTK